MKTPNPTGQRQAKRAVQRAGAAGVGGPHFTAGEWLELVRDQGDACACCGAVGGLKGGYGVPVPLGGPNTNANVQGLCASCNCLKGGESTDYRPGRSQAVAFLIYR